MCMEHKHLECETEIWMAPKNSYFLWGLPLQVWRMCLLNLLLVEGERALSYMVLLVVFVHLFVLSWQSYRYLFHEVVLATILLGKHNLFHLFCQFKYREHRHVGLYFPSLILKIEKLRLLRRGLPSKYWVFSSLQLVIVRIIIMIWVMDLVQEPLRWSTRHVCA